MATKSKSPQAHYATGRRKTTSARVYFTPSGEHNILINGRTLENYFGRKTDHIKVLEPIKVVDLKKGTFYITVKGGGTTGQADAIAHGIARVLLKYDETMKSLLKKEGLLTRDARKVERKKYGLKKARKDEQYSKR
jgi:small subunit ribosomal protein S9